MLKILEKLNFFFELPNISLTPQGIKRISINHHVEHQPDYTKQEHFIPHQDLWKHFYEAQQCKPIAQ